MMFYSFQRFSFVICFRRWFVDRPILLGRWKITYEPEQLEERIRRSNQDHSM